MLLNNEANVNAEGEFLGTALQRAAFQVHTEVVKLLLNNEADVNAQNGHYGTALQAAALRGHIEMVKLFLNNGADVNAQGGICGNALNAAKSEMKEWAKHRREDPNDYKEIIQILLNAGAKDTSDSTDNLNSPTSSSALPLEEHDRPMTPNTKNSDLTGGEWMDE